MATNPTQTKESSAGLFIVDNSDSNWKVRSYLTEWCDYSRAIDIATGYFEIGSLLALEDKWQAVDHFRILMGDEVSMRTKRAFAEGLKKIAQRLDGSLEAEKAKDDFLVGVPAIVAAIRAGKIECRVYRKDKFHAKAYITHGRAAVVGSFGLVGSSNFTCPGLCDNVELNVQVRGSEVGLLQEWYERHWQDAEDITPDILRTLERHTDPRTPFEIWFKALHEFLRGRGLTPDAWDRQESKIFPVLARYQQDAYKNLVGIAGQFGGAFLCDGVGLGKTFVGLMLIERMVAHEGQRVVLFAPKAAREDVWDPEIARRLPDLNSGFENLRLFNHTDLQRKDEKFLRRLELTLRDADIVIIDEAHHFRNLGIAGEGERAPSRYRRLRKFLAAGRPKRLFLLTATPVNNSIHDLRHQVELFTQGRPDWFAAQLGIHNLQSHFVQLEKKLLGKLPPKAQSTLDFGPELRDAEQALHEDWLFKSVVVQRSRAYVKDSQRLLGGSASLFPERTIPQVAAYDLKATYGRLLDSLAAAFNRAKPLFFLTIYNPLDKWLGAKDDPLLATFEAGRQAQVVTLIRTLFLKRFESSSAAFEASCWRLLQKLLAWVTVHAESATDLKHFDKWKTTHGALIGYVHAHQQELWPADADEDETEEFLSEDQLAEALAGKLSPDHYDISEIIRDTLADMDTLAEFLGLLSAVKPAKDDKLQALIRLLKTDAVLKKQKVIVFTEFAETARYLEKELAAAGIVGLHRIDGRSTQPQRSAVIHRFAPYYNGSSSAAVAAAGGEEIRVLISTDVLSEGLNLQDATRLINYDLHWNPVRLMQRIGRVDRRMNPEIEARIVADHPDQKKLRGTVAFWNFLPPDELEILLGLFNRVTRKTLVISRTFGIEGRKLLTPDDEFDPIREMNAAYEQQESVEELLEIEYLRLVAEHPDLAAELPTMPLKVFTGKASPKPGTRAVFFCHRIPRPDANLVPAGKGDAAEPRWSDAAGFTVWSCYDLDGNRVLTDPGAIAAFIRSKPETPRHCSLDRVALSDLRKKVEKQLIGDHLRPLQAPVGVSPILKCWMELN